LASSFLIIVGIFFSLRAASREQTLSAHSSQLKTHN